ncbi:MAG: TVP38/TMEM64 family protein [Burkholderiales bacterium]
MRADSSSLTLNSVERTGPNWGKIVLIALAVTGLAAAWRYTPLAQYVAPERIIDWAHTFGEAPWAPIVVMAAYTPAAFVMFPRPLITLFAVIAFGSVLGFIYGLIGILGAALATYYAGRVMRPHSVRRLIGDKLNDMTVVLRRRGLLACFAMRVVPAAPFVIEGIAAGAVRIKVWHYSLGTLLGMAPGTLTTSVFGDQIQTALADPSRINYWLIAGVVVFFIVLIMIVRRWFIKQLRLAHRASAREHTAL